MWTKLSSWSVRLIWMIFLLVMVIITLSANIRFSELITHYITPMKMYWGFVALIGGIVLLGLFGKRIVHFLQNGFVPWISKHIYGVLIGMTALSLGLRALWISVFRVVGFEDDYAGYHERATSFAQGIFPQDNFVGLFPHTFGFPYILSFVYRVFGSSTLVPAIFNMVLIVLCIALFLLLFPPKQYPVRTFLFVTVFGLWPSFIFYVLVPNTEYFYMFLWLVIMVVLKQVGKTQSVGKECGLSVLFGFLLSSCNYVRPVGNVLMIAFLVSALFLLMKPWWRKGLMVGLVFVAYYLTAQWFNHQVGVKAQTEVATLPIGFAFYVGMNPNPIGGELGLWNMDDAGEFGILARQVNDPQKSQNLAIESGMDRLKKIVKDKELSHFLYLKTRTAWGTDHWAMHYSAYQVETHPKDEKSVALMAKLYEKLIIIGDFIYTVFLILVTIVLGRHFWKDRGRSIGFLSLQCALLVIGTYLMLLFVESDPRYHLPALLAIFVLVAEALDPGKVEARVGLDRKGKSLIGKNGRKGNTPRGVNLRN